MKVLLIEFNPFQPVHTPISLGFLAARLKQLGSRAEILNLGSDAAISPRQLARFLTTFRPDLIGFSAYQRNVFLLKGLAAACREILPECLLLLGGPQATFIPTGALVDLAPIDLVCRAEGEAAMAELVRQASSIRGRVLRDLPGWSGRDPEGRLWDGPRLDPAENLDEYPSPYLDGTLQVKGVEEAILLSSRGCPYQCSFCYTPLAFGRRIRTHSVTRVAEEMLWLWRQGVRRFWFADPSFTFRPERVHRLFDQLLSCGCHPDIWLETRADLVDRDLLLKMKQAGVHTVAYGLESACAEVLIRIRKPLDLDQVEKAIRLTQEAGLEVELFSQYGLPGERFADARNTLAFVKKNRVRIQGNTNPQQMQVYFGTPIERNPEAYGIRRLAESVPSYLSLGSRYETEWMTASEIRAIGRLWLEASEDGGKHLVS